MKMTDNDVADCLEVGITGIFMAMEYNETSVREENGAVLYLSDIAQYGLPDGVRYLFLDTEEGPVFDRNTYRNISDAEDFREIEVYVERMVAETDKDSSE